MWSLFHPITGSLFLFGRHIFESTLHLFLSLRIHTIESAKIFSDGALFIGRQISVLAVALSYLVFSLIGQLLPVGETRLGVFALIFAHAGPVLRPPGQALPALGRQAIPIVFKLGQDSLLRLAETGPAKRIIAMRCCMAQQQ